MSRIKRGEIQLYGDNGSKKEPFLWTEVLRTGHARIDAQHQELYTSFSGINKMLALPGMNINYWFSMVLRQTDDYVVRHFSDEEQLMSEIQYPGYVKHRHQHVKIVEQLKDHQSVIKQLKTNDEKLEESRSLMAFTSEWLNKHVMIEDKKIVAFIQNKLLS